MKRFFLTIAVLGLFAASMAGCKASGDIQPTHASNAAIPQ